MSYKATFVRSAISIASALTLALTSACTSTGELSTGATDKAEMAASDANQVEETAQPNDYVLTKTVTYQGVALKCDESWEVSQEDECPLVINLVNDSGTIRVYPMLYGEVLKLETAFKVSGLDIEENQYVAIDRWSSEGYRIIAGEAVSSAVKETYEYALVMFEGDSGRGFLLRLSLEQSSFDHKQSRTLLDSLVESIEYDPSLTKLDYNDYEFEKENPDLYTTDDSTDASSTDGDTAIDEQQTTASPTLSQKNAVQAAKDYLDYKAFSYSGLIDQLEYEGYSTEDATYGHSLAGGA